MTLPEKIQLLIDEIKQQKNHLERNKMVSHLEDALAWAMRQSNKVPESLAATAPVGTHVGTSVIEQKVQAMCTCPYPSVVDKNCPIHSALVL